MRILRFLSVGTLFAVTVTALVLLSAPVAHASLWDTCQDNCDTFHMHDVADCQQLPPEDVNDCFDQAWDDLTDCAEYCDETYGNGEV